MSDSGYLSSRSAASKFLVADWLSLANLVSSCQCL